ncbi:hypothetical protein GCM10009716_21310 [Streptomyces sodiiphilus]|uniref:Uncharacterized protein n=1 Tax=Streptomyces sodiiphilus TaxID=226217 RepID=A0ABN2P2Z2_9ACTN
MASTGVPAEVGSSRGGVTSTGAKSSAYCWTARATLGGRGASRTSRPLSSAEHRFVRTVHLAPDVDDFPDDGEPFNATQEPFKQAFSDILNP